MQQSISNLLDFLVFGLADATDSIAMNPAVTSLDSSFQQSLLGLFVTFSAIVALPIPALCAAYNCHDRRKLVSPLVCLHWVLRTRFDALLVLLSCYHPISGMRYLFHCEFAFLRADELCPHLPHIRPQMPDRFDRVTFDLCLPSLAPMRVLCIAGFGPDILSPGICLNNPALAKRRMMLMCRKIRRQRRRQCRRMSWGPHRMCHAVGLEKYMKYQNPVNNANAYIHSLHAMWRCACHKTQKEPKRIFEWTERVT
jgi:hypothetical protein